MEDRLTASPRRLLGRAILIALAAWALALILPGLYRVASPLAAFGVSVDNDGVVTDIVSPFRNAGHSPAARAGIVLGDRIDLRVMRCPPLGTAACADALVLFGGLGGMHYVRPGSRVALVFLPRDSVPVRTVDLRAARPHWDGLVSFVLLAQTLVGAAVIVTAFLLAWRRPGPMTWGFFLFAIWFNPGQTYTFYTLIQPWPAAIFAEELTEAFAQAAAYCGLLLLALCFPGDVVEPAWRPVQRALPVLFVLLAALNLASFANNFGHPTEAITRASFLIGYVVDALVLVVLLVRRRALAPQDDQRMRWVIAGCAIGLPAFIFAEMAQSSALFATVWNGVAPPRAVIGLLYLLNGVLAAFVSEAIRRPRVVSVAVPLRHGTITTALTVLAAVPVFTAHEWLSHHKDVLDLPESFWLFVVGPLLLVVLNKLHEVMVHLADRVFSRSYHRARETFERLSADLRAAHSPDEVDRLLTLGPVDTLGLASAAVFRREQDAFRRRAGVGWDATMGNTLDHAEDAAVTRAAATGKPLRLARGAWNRADVPQGVARPCLAVPVRGLSDAPVAVAVYGAHDTGSDLDADERGMLEKLARRAAYAYERVETDALRREVARLRARLAAAELPVAP